jgi:hypothetical protein
LGDDADKSIHARRINMLSHGKYSIFEPQEMVEENKEQSLKLSAIAHRALPNSSCCSLMIASLLLLILEIIQN